MIISKFLNENENYSVYDIGCGNLPFFLEFNKNFTHYHGIDLLVNPKKYDNIVLEKTSIREIDFEELIERAKEDH